MQTRSAIMCLEGVKRVALWPHLRSSAQDDILRSPPTADSLSRLTESHQGSVVVLSAGQGVMVEPGVWHVALNDTCCISFNSSVCSEQEVYDMAVGTCQWVSSPTRSKKSVPSMLGRGFWRVVSEAIDREAINAASAYKHMLQVLENCSVQHMGAEYASLHASLTSWADFLMTLWDKGHMSPHKAMGCSKLWLVQHQLTVKHGIAQVDECIIATQYS